MIKEHGSVDHLLLREIFIVHRDQNGFDAISNRIEKWMHRGMHQRMNTLRRWTESSTALLRFDHLLAEHPLFDLLQQKTDSVAQRASKQGKSIHRFSCRTKSNLIDHGTEVVENVDGRNIAQLCRCRCRNDLTTFTIGTDLRRKLLAQLNSSRQCKSCPLPIVHIYRREEIRRRRPGRTCQTYLAANSWMALAVFRATLFTRVSLTVVTDSSLEEQRSNVRKSQSRAFLLDHRFDQIF